MATIIGTAAADVLSGTGGADRIFGLGGDDALAGGGGDDLLVGGTGADTLEGGAGADTLVGGTQDLRLDGGAGFDTARFDGSASADRWRVGTGLAFDDPGLRVFGAGGGGSSGVSLSGVERLEFNGGAGADSLVVEDVFGTRVVPVLSTTARVVGIEGLTFDGGGGNDTLDGSAANGPLLGRGGAGDDRLIGGDGDDTLLGGAGRDTLLGGAGTDILNGGVGDDVLVGSLGPDVLTGGSGADVFRFLTTDDPVAPNARVRPETITDFGRAEGDRIDLSAIDARPDLPGDQAFWFADGIEFVAYQPGLVRTFPSEDGATTLVQADTGAGVLNLVVAGRVEFTAADFIL